VFRYDINSGSAVDEIHDHLPGDFLGVERYAFGNDAMIGCHGKNALVGYLWFRGCRDAGDFNRDILQFSEASLRFGE
jgi:hypothetical protein